MEDSLELKKKTYLNSYTTLSAESESLKKQIIAFRANAHSSRTQLYGGSSCASNDNQEEKLLDKWEEDYKRTVTRCGEIYCKIENMGDEREKTVLKMHYLRGMSIEEIADKIHLSPRLIGFTSGRWSIFSWNPIKLDRLITRLFFKALFSAAYSVRKSG